MADKYTSRYTGQQIDQALGEAMNIDQTIQNALGSFTVPSNQILNGAVTTAKIADGAVTAAKLADPVIIVKEFTQDNLSIAASAQGHMDIYESQFAIAGYTPVGLVNVYKVKASSSGANEHKCMISNLCFYDGHWRVTLYNLGTSAAKLQVFASLLYVKNELLDLRPVATAAAE